MARLPKQIKQWLKHEKGIRDHIGESDSQVILYDTLVLKQSTPSLDARREARALQFLEGYLPVPHVIETHETQRFYYLLMSKCAGKPLFQWPLSVAIEQACEGLKRLWTIHIVDAVLNTPKTALETIKHNVLNHRTTLIENADEGTFTSERYKDPETLLTYLVDHYPYDAPVVLSHGDYYLPNVLFDGTKITGMIDFGYVGYFPKERDISALIKSLVYNYGENPNYLLWIEQTLHETFNPNIIEYFMLYDELI